MRKFRLFSSTPHETRSTSHPRIFVVAFACLSLVLPAVCRGQTGNSTETPASQSSVGAGTASAPVSIGSLTDEPISPGETVHVYVFHAPDFSFTTKVSESGDIPFPMLGVVHLAGLSSQTAADLIGSELTKRNLMLDPNVTVTVDTTSTGITVLGEVRLPGIFPPLGKRSLSDLIAAAGGMTASAGRVIEISNARSPEKKTYIPWDPTMRNTTNYDLPVHPGDRVLVEACGFVYVGGSVIKPGAYALCGTPNMTLSEVLALAGDLNLTASERHTIIIHTQPDGSRIVQEYNLGKILRAKAGDPFVKEDDIVYVAASNVKLMTARAMQFTLNLAGPLLYLYH